MEETKTADSAPRDLRSVAQFAELFPAFTQAALRSYILNAEDRVNSRNEIIFGNGLKEAGAIIRVGRKVLLSEGRFFLWIAAQQAGAGRSDRDRTKAPASKTRANEMRPAA
jgi:hypothetical protein